MNGELKFIASPGIAILEDVEEEKTSSLVKVPPKTGRIKKARIISMGVNLVTEANAVLEAHRYGKIGDTIYFLHYYEEGGYDYCTINGKKYFFVKWQDFRGIVG